LFAAALAPTLAFAAPSVPTLPPSALRPGQPAVVRTVFAGDSVETFEAEIVGVLPGGRSEGDMILARATSPRVERTGVAQGMSGSPVYVDGKLIGALSSGWSFSKEPVFGITPIGEMLSVLDQPDLPPGEGTPGPVGAEPTAASPRFHEFSWTGDDSALETRAGVPPVAASRSWLPLPLAASGLHPGAMATVRALFEPEGFAVVPGGRDRTPEKRATLEPGAAVAVDVMRGDLNLSAIGTVTYRDGDRVLIFGHPFFQSGDVRLPLSTARITTILGSLNNSFKLGVPGTAVGTATQDRRAAVAGRLGPAPKLLPIRVAVAGTSPRAKTFTYESIDDRSMLPQLVSTAALNSLLESGGEGAMQTVGWSLVIWRGGRALRLADVCAGEAPLNDLVSSIANPVRFLATNPYTRFHADSLVIELETRAGRTQSALRAATLVASRVRPGGVAHVRAELERWRGARETVTLDVPVPEELPDGRYVLHVAGGLEADRFTAARLPSRFRPISLDDAWERLAEARRSDVLHAGLWARAPEIDTDGDDLPELPTSALALLAPPQQAGDRARRGDWALVEEVRRRTDGVVRGDLLLELVVDRQAP
jgi:SpoIVB peptidase S55